MEGRSALVSATIYSSAILGVLMGLSSLFGGDSSDTLAHRVEHLPADARELHYYVHIDAGARRRNIGAAIVGSS